MLKLNVNNETSRLLAVVLGTAKSNGLTPKLEECYDPKSRQNVLNNTYPTEINMINEMNYHKNIYDFFRSKKQFMIVPSSVTIVTKKSAI